MNICINSCDVTFALEVPVPFSITVVLLAGRMYYAVNESGDVMSLELFISVYRSVDRQCHDEAAKKESSSRLTSSAQPAAAFYCIEKFLFLFMILATVRC